MVGEIADDVPVVELGGVEGRLDVVVNDGVGVRVHGDLVGICRRIAGPLV